MVLSAKFVDSGYCITTPAELASFRVRNKEPTTNAKEGNMCRKWRDGDDKVVVMDDPNDPQGHPFDEGEESDEGGDKRKVWLD